MWHIAHPPVDRPEERKALCGSEEPAFGVWEKKTAPGVCPLCEQLHLNTLLRMMLQRINKEAKDQHTLRLHAERVAEQNKGLVDKLNEETLALRRILWLTHKGHLLCLYGDDGEMQCPKCMLDFKRDSVEKIERHLC